MARGVYEIGADLEALADLMNEAPDGELSPEAAAAVEAWFAEVQADQANKLDGYVWMIRWFEADESVAKATADQFQRKAKAAGNKADRLKARLLGFLSATGQAKARTASGWEVRVQANGTTPVVIDPDADPASLPERFRLVRVEVSKAAVAKALAAGEELAFARWGEKGHHLRIV